MFNSFKHFDAKIRLSIYYHYYAFFSFTEYVYTWISIISISTVASQIHPIFCTILFQIIWVRKVYAICTRFFRYLLQTILAAPWRFFRINFFVCMRILYPFDVRAFLLLDCCCEKGSDNFIACDSCEYFVIIYSCFLNVILATNRALYFSICPYEFLFVLKIHLFVRIFLFSGRGTRTTMFHSLLMFQILFLLLLVINQLHFVQVLRLLTLDLFFLLRYYLTLRSWLYIASLIFWHFRFARFLVCQDLVWQCF